MRKIHMLSLAAALAMSGAMAVSASAATVAYTADLKSSSESPPNASKGTGEVVASFDTVSSKLSWTVTYAGLRAPRRRRISMGRPRSAPTPRPSYRFRRPAWQAR